MEIRFHKFVFNVENEKVSLQEMGNLIREGECGIAEVQICGENKNTHMGIKMPRSSEGERLVYVSHNLTKNKLEIVQKSPFVQVKTVFKQFKNANAVCIYTEVTNILAQEIVLEEVSSFTAWGLGKSGLDSAEELYFTRFYQSHHAECQPKRNSFAEHGLFKGNVEGQKRLACANIGSWSTKEELPQGILEDVENGEVLMFQIESNASWYYEIGDRAGKYYLYLGGPNLPFGGWSKALKTGECYRTPTIALAFGKTVSETLCEMTKYRRCIAPRNKADEALPAIFNEYMHLSWDSPTEENTRRIAPVVAKTGVEYYVIDCGWHNEEDGDKVYPYVGQWIESKKRFPHGFRQTTDYIRSLGMKAGLWIEPEIVGIECKEMLDFYDDDCFFQRNGKRIAVMGRYFLDYRNEKVRVYMSETIRRMVEDYGADYIKFDYNQDCGIGNDYLALCAGEGLELCAVAFQDWVKDMCQRFPNVVFEGCASGGMRMDYKMLSIFSLASTSDQTDYQKYPYIAGNILSSILPEQAAVWSYPVGVGTVGKPLCVSKEWVWENISKERIAVNMINSFLGRMHLASHLELLNEEQFALVQEGVAYYKTLSRAKKNAVPYFPNGFTKFGANHVVAGFKTEEKIYLAVWKLGGSNLVEVDIDEDIEMAKLTYPLFYESNFSYKNKTLCMQFIDEPSAAFFELTLKQFKEAKK